MRAHSRIRLHVLGALDLLDEVGRENVVVLRQPKRVILLTYLAVTGRRRHVYRDELLALFWPELDNGHARNALRTALSRLRGALGADPFQVRGTDALRIDADVLWCDAAAFADSHETDPAAALELYKGDLLAGVHAPDVAPELERWMDDERRELRASAAQAAWRVVESAESAGDSARAVAAARRAMGLSPHDEQGLRRLMAILVRAGDRAGALETYEEFARRIARELEAHPAPETQAAMIRVRGTHPPVAANATSDSVPAPAVPAHPAGTRPRLRAIVAGLAAAMLAAIAIRAGVDSNPFSTNANAASVVARPEWSRLALPASPPPRYHTRLALDRSGDTGVIFGGRIQNSLMGDVWRLSGIAVGQPRWTRVYPAAGAAPPARWLHGVAYAAPMDRLILFGGSLGFSWPCANDVWLLDGVSRGAAKWTALALEGPGPAPRADMSVVYDPATNRLIVFGGHDCVARRFDDVWSLAFADGTNGAPRWERLTPLAPRGTPGPRSGHVAVFDPIGNRLIVHGGTDGARLVDDVWVLRNANGVGGLPEWEPVPVRGVRPVGRAYHVAGYDATTGQLVMFAGSSAFATTQTDNATWVLAVPSARGDSATWRRVDFAGQQPPARFVHAAAFDAVRQQLVVFGGLGSTPPEPLRDVWVLRNVTR